MSLLKDKSYEGIGVGLVRTAFGNNIFIKNSVNAVSFENNETGRVRETDRSHKNQKCNQYIKLEIQLVRCTLVVYGNKGEIKEEHGDAFIKLK